jgi:hypothetical protein
MMNMITSQPGQSEAKVKNNMIWSREASATAAQQQQYHSPLLERRRGGTMSR